MRDQSSDSRGANLIELHTSASPNGRKVILMLEETGLGWQQFDVNIRLGEQFAPAHLQLNPNNKIPAIRDTDGPAGAPYTMMESGAILIYLAQKAGRFLSSERAKHFDTLQWLFFQMAHVGPMFGQANHFNLYATEVEYARGRYNNEVQRLFRVLDNRLHASPWLGCDEYSIADIATYPWTQRHGIHGIDSSNSPNFLRWFQAMEARPAVQRMKALAAQIEARLDRQTEGKQQVNLTDTKDNAERLAKATAR
jgi:GST-like protein